MNADVTLVAKDAALRSVTVQVDLYDDAGSVVTNTTEGTIASIPAGATKTQRLDFVGVDSGGVPLGGWPDDPQCEVAVLDAVPDG